MTKNIYYEMSKDFIELANDLFDNKSELTVKTQKDDKARVSMLDHVKRRFRYIFLGEK